MFLRKHNAFLRDTHDSIKKLNTLSQICASAPKIQHVIIRGALIILLTML